MRYRVYFVLSVFIAVIVSLVMIVSCNKDGVYVVVQKTLSEQLPKTGVGDSRQNVVQEMKNAEVAMKSDAQLSYYLNGICKLVTYAFEGDEIVAMVAYVDADKVTWNELVAEFASYRMLENSKGEISSYLSEDNTIYGEVRSIFKDGIQYYTIGWSLIR